MDEFKKVIRSEINCLDIHDTTEVAIYETSVKEVNAYGKSVSELICMLDSKIRYALDIEDVSIKFEFIESANYYTGYCIVIDLSIEELGLNPSMTVNLLLRTGTDEYYIPTIYVSIITRITELQDEIISIEISEYLV